MKRLFAMIALVGCGDDGAAGGRDGGGGGGGVMATATVFNGATPAGMAFAPRLGPPPAPPENGQWLATPRTMEMKLVTVGLSPGGGLVTLDCSVTYDSTRAGLTQLAECPFMVPPGTFDTIDVGFSTSVRVVVDDAAAGIFSTASGFQTTPPAGGATEYSYMIGGMPGETRLSPFKLSQPITVAEGDSLQVSVVIDALQSVRLTVNGSTITPGHSGSPFSSDPGRPDIIATAGTIAKIKTYVASSLNTAESYCAGMCTSSPPQGITAVGTFYTSATSVSIVNLRLNGTPSTCAQQLYPAFVNVPKAYVGLDSAGVAGWAVGADPSFTSYSAVFAMPQVATIGSTTPLYCANTSTDPMPASGSFASGAPSIQVVGNSLGDYILVAQ